ncbi:MAG: NAD+ synthase [Candidatus Eisenbacteria bacterium]|nr:NAD+ synthase [Candidatus Latescibacterota bacterium]MBD3300840.1 NAD+ synthase [Candidatus Eisenbacteria bacterium]
MSLRIALAQINPVVGDLPGNRSRIAEAIDRVADLAPDLIAFPELVVTGYPPEDLLHYPRFVQEAEEVADDLAARYPALRLLLGCPIRENGDLYNAALLLHGGGRIARYRKCTLPNYGVFDEKRYFRPGRTCPVLRIGPWRIGPSICEDIWAPGGVPRKQAEAGANLLVNISSSPYHARKGEERAALIRTRARQHGATVAYVNLVGGQDELVFDGESLIAAPDGTVLARAARFEEDLLVHDLDPWTGSRTTRPVPGFVQPRYEEIGDLEEDLVVERIDCGDSPEAERVALPARPAPSTGASEEEEIYGALVLGTRDYVRKNGFDEVVVGLSGGIDSALTATIAADALGGPAVHALTMPSGYTSAASLEGASALAANLAIPLSRIEIDPLRAAYAEALHLSLGADPAGVTEENIQARIRGNLLMALSNDRGWLVLTTGNKSELAVGYCTLYGDMAGGFAVLKDVPKGLVYRLAEWRNARTDGPVIPQETIQRAPSAELRADQKDTDTLPPYPVLDPIVEARVEREDPPEALIARGFDPEVVLRVYAMIEANEYKRRQAPPGIKITPRAFGRDRRYPITNRYRARLR